ncbi:ATP-binding protein [Rubellicoccus peritrichatus]|uniref:histidine kinase n=1 Tax=Rubellicoccus peritrichatus TaxID=3080537 RepID=A0AAQ3LAA3_9BACT|nr:ATP-binding protein [Puniceicoccus sp. CR14]WOO40255.1 ATP-binding protein [Puniceicoccus sp. CR14]
MVSKSDTESHSWLLQQWESEVNRTILKGQPSNMLLSWLLACFFAVVVGFESTWPPVVVWLGLMVVASALRMLIWGALKKGHLNLDSNKTAHRWLVLNTLITGVPWGAAGFYFWALHDTTISSFTIFILGGVTAGAIPLMAASRQIYAVFIITCLAPITVRFFIEPAFAGKFMGLVMSFYIFFMIRQAVRYRDVLWERFRLTSDKDKLIKDLGREIDDHRKTEDMLRAEKERAESASRAKTDFVATMSHEIRTPLNSLVGGVQLIRNEKVTPQLEEAVELLELSSQSLLSIVSDILDFSKIEDGKMEVEHVPFNPVRPIFEVHMLYKAEAEKRGLAFTLNVSPSIPRRLVGDPGRIRQILINLIGNALKFTHKGEISITADYDSAGKTWKIVCSDTGTGIAQEYKRLIFEPFRQADSSMSRKFGGSGLGLAICESLAKAMGGSISLSTELGMGSKFTLKLPAEVAKGSANEELSEDVSKSTETTQLSGRVLLFEDDPVSQRVMNMLLTREGLAILNASDGKAGLEILEREKVELVLMDLQMPGMDGFETTRRIRMLPEDSATSAEVIVIALTANTTTEIRQRCLEAGMEGFVSKPLKIEQLRPFLYEYLE